ncbi:MAG: hypothetical protein C4554_01165 [Dethiobacter sp.]|jgi:L-ascorbate metabolism protein UlaG (beta-lactamase superfamily)|nr:MAG: hypothetical protein C4554_01165 [Dethiobacter sp.]
MRKKGIFLWILVIILSTGLTATGCQSTPEKRTGEPGVRVEDEGKKDDAGEDESDMDERQAEDIPAKKVKLQFRGHACFLMEVDGLRILTDPYSPQVGYGTLDVQVNVVTVSHEHMDHNYTAAASGAQIIRGLTADGLGWEDVSFAVGDINISSLATYHDDAAGKLRGRNAVFVFDIGNLRLVHLGDLGHVFNEGEVEKLKPVDVLIIPVGGHYTIDAQEAKQVVEQLSPAVVIPMHYKTKVIRNWPIAELKTFLEGEENVKEKGSKPVYITRDELPKSTEIWILEPAKL